MWSTDLRRGALDSRLPALVIEICVLFLFWLFGEGCASGPPTAPSPLSPPTLLGILYQRLALECPGEVFEHCLNTTFGQVFKHCLNTTFLQLFTQSLHVNEVLAFER